LQAAFCSNQPGFLQKSVVLQHDNAQLRDRPVRQTTKFKILGWKFKKSKGSHAPAGA